MHSYFQQRRHQVQLAFLLITIGIGVQFYIYVEQSMGVDPVTVQRPPGVEGFLPIGALMGWKRFLMTGQFDTIHPAAMVILGYAVLLSFLLRKSFCSWFCPVGTISEWCFKVGQSLLGRNLRIPVVLDIPLRSLKYLLLGFFVWAISRMSIDQITVFLHSPYYALSDVKMLLFFTRMTLLSAIVLTCLVLFSFLYKNFWCRYLCPYGALMGLFSMPSPASVRRHEGKCIDCGKCTDACPSFLPVAGKRVVRSAECTGCMDCVGACPVAGALELRAFSHTRGHAWSQPVIGWLIALSFAMTVYVSSITGHWQGSVSTEAFRVGLRSIDAPENTHPTIDF